MNSIAIREYNGHKKKKRETVALEAGGSSCHTWSQIVFEVTAMANNQKKRNQYIRKVATTVFVSLAALVISLVVWLFNLLKLIDIHKFKFCTVLRLRVHLHPAFSLMRTTV